MGLNRKQRRALKSRGIKLPIGGPLRTKEEISKDYVETADKLVELVLNLEAARNERTRLQSRLLELRAEYSEAVSKEAPVEPTAPVAEVINEAV